MRVESIRLKNFKAFRDVDMREIPGFCVLIGANGAGKSTLFSVFAFLRDAMATNVTTALAKLGGSRGFQEVRSRGCEGAIEIELKIRADLGRSKQSLITYSLEIGEVSGRAVVERRSEDRRAAAVSPGTSLISAANREAVTNEMGTYRHRRDPAEAGAPDA